MLSSLLIAATLAGASTDPLELAIERFRALQTYRVTLHSSHADGEEHLRYFYRKPGQVRMEFIHPHAGAVLIYDPVSRRALLWPFGAGHFPKLNLSPDNPLIRSPRGQRVDKSDVGALLDNVQALRQNGSMTTYGEERWDERATQHIGVTGKNDYTIASVHRYELWLDATTLFPLKVVSRDRNDAVLETVRMDELEIDSALPPELFAPPD